MKVFSRGWTESGIRTFPSKRLLHVGFIRDDYQGDMLYMLTIHIFKRAFQVVYWNYNYQSPSKKRRLPFAQALAKRRS